MAKVDVILCTNNKDPEGLERTLASLQSSTFHDARILIVNDSPHPLQGRLMDHPLPLSIIQVGSNQGLTKALKIAEASLSAPYVARIDCGDEMHPDRLLLQAEYLDAHPGCVLVGAASRLYLRKGGKAQDCGVSRSSTRISSMRSILRNSNPFVHGSIMMKASAFFSVGGYDPKYKVAQDYNLYLRMLKAGDLAILGATLYTHYFKAESSTTIRRNRESVLYGLRSRLNILPMRDILTTQFVFGALRDLIILALPITLVSWVRFGTLKWRLSHGDTVGN